MPTVIYDTDKKNATAALIGPWQQAELLVTDAIAAERERCAKICDDIARSNRTTRKGEGAELCAHRIRSGG